MNQRKCRMFSVLNEEQPASWPHLPLRSLLAVRLAWDVSIKIAERNCLETLPYINRSVLKKRVACIGTVQSERVWGVPNKHFAAQNRHLYRRMHCLPQQCVPFGSQSEWKAEHSTAPKFSKRSWSRSRTLRRTIKSSIKQKYGYIQASHWNIAVYFLYR